MRSTSLATNLSKHHMPSDPLRFANFAICSLIFSTPFLSNSRLVIGVHIFFCIFLFQWLVFSNKCVLFKLEHHFRGTAMNSSAFNFVKATGLDALHVWYALILLTGISAFKLAHLTHVDIMRRGMKLTRYQST